MKLNQLIKNIVVIIAMAAVFLNTSIAAEFVTVKALNEPLVLAKKYEVYSQILGQNRKFYLHLPAGYPKAGQQYPVLYIPDGKRKMQKTVTIVDDLATFGRRIPEMIVVGIETNENRRDDLSQFDSSVAFLNFITKELKPYINSNYKTSGENLLMGSSMGGEFVVRALLEQPDEFDGYFAISPSIYYSDFQLVEKAKTVSTSKQVLNKNLYLSVANEGWNQGVEELVYHLKKYPIQGLKWQFTKREQESHGSISLVQGYLGLQDYYKKWRAPHFANTQDFEDKGGVAGLKAFYQQRTPAIIPIGILDHLALLYVDQARALEAIELSLLAVKEHPTSGRALRNIAVVYEKLGELTLAKKAYQQAITVAIKNNHRASSIAAHKKALAAFNKRNSD